jgi:acetoin utilization protein AcuB
MTKKIVTIDAEAAIDEAKKLLREKKIHMLPVIGQEKLVGVITCRDIIDALYPDDLTVEDVRPDQRLRELRVKDVMTKDVQSVSTDSTIEEVADILLKHDISSAPVINREGELAGVVTHSDLSKALICLAGGTRGGILYGILLEDRPGSIKELADIIRAHGGRLASILTSIEGVSKGSRKVYIRVYDMDRFGVNVLNAALKKTADVFMISERPEIVRQFSPPNQSVMPATISNFIQPGSPEAK